VARVVLGSARRSTNKELTMINASQIKPHTPVVCSDNRQLAMVDHLEGTETIKLTKDDKGQHHYIPTSWVKSVDDKVHLDRPGDQAMREWSTTPTAAPAKRS
jgi:hypothetical protein